MEPSFRGFGWRISCLELSGFSGFGFPEPVCFFEGLGYRGLGFRVPGFGHRPRGFKVQKALVLGCPRGGSLGLVGQGTQRPVEGLGFKV